jgi:hypothetical protein
MSDYNAVLECIDQSGGGHIKGKLYYVRNGCLQFENDSPSRPFESLSDINHFFTSQFREVNGEKQMTKKDLKTGMKVTTLNGNEYLVFMDIAGGNGLANYNRRTWLPLCDINDDLECMCNRSLDVIRVCVTPFIADLLNKDATWNTLWEREEEPVIEEITAEEAMRRLEESSGKKIKITR